MGIFDSFKKQQQQVEQLQRRAQEQLTAQLRDQKLQAIEIFQAHQQVSNAAVMLTECETNILEACQVLGTLSEVDTKGLLAVTKEMATVRQHLQHEIVTLTKTVKKITV